MSDDQNLLNVDETCAQMKIRPHIYMKLVTSFVDSLEGKLKNFQSFLENDDREQMRMILHEIKGTAGNLRLYTLTGPEAVLHTALKAGAKTDVLKSHFAVLSEAVIQLREVIKKMPADPG